jgi:membrane protein DedA with SNARE-associated domain
MSSENRRLPDIGKPGTENKQTEHVPKKEIVVGITAVVFTIAICVVAILYKDDIMNRATAIGYSLFGLLIISFLAGSILSFTAIPIPYWFLVFTFPSILAPQWGLLAPVGVGLTSALGATFGHMPTFMLGYGGRSITRKLSNRFSNSWYGRWYQKVINWSQRHGWIAVFATSALPNPVHLPMTVAFGSLRYPPYKFFIYSLLGNVVKSLFLAFAGYFGLTSLLKFLGIN